MTRPQPHVPGRYDATSPAYRLGAEIAENLIAMVTPAEFITEYRRHLDAMAVADTDPTMTPYPGQYDGFAGFAHKAWALITERKNRS